MLRLYLYIILLLTLSSCDADELAQKSFGNVNDPNSKADPSNVISMGRDDDDGKAKKWHIGGTRD